MTGWSVSTAEPEGAEGMGEGGAGVRIIELRDALSCAIELKWNLSHRTISQLYPLSLILTMQSHWYGHVPEDLQRQMTIKRNRYALGSFPKISPRITLFNHLKDLKD